VRRRARRALYISGGLVVGWFVLLLILDVALAGRQARHTEQRLAESLHAQVSVGEVDVGLIAGSLSLAHIVARRDDAVGHLSLDVAEVDCSLAPLGIALFDRHCSDLAVRGLRMEVSTAAVFAFHRPKHKPIEIERITIDDATLAFSPSALVPNLGRIEIRIEHAAAGHTVLRTPISWLLTMSELRANLSLPAGFTIRMTFENGQLTAAGDLFGSAPVTIPVDLPVKTLPEDGKAELRQLVGLGTQIAERLVAKRAEDWLQRKLHL
jgi:hypothetical protein